MRKTTQLDSVAGKCSRNGRGAARFCAIFYAISAIFTIFTIFPIQFPSNRELIECNHCNKATHDMTSEAVTESVYLGPEFGSFDADIASMDIDQ